MPRERRFGCTAMLVVLALGAVWLGQLAWHDTMMAPVVRRASVVVPGMQAGTKPVTIALLSDLHVAGPGMPPARLARIVDQVNALHPDVVGIVGDFVSDMRLSSRTYTTAESVAPLAQLRPRLATVAVLGNHDFWRGGGGVQRELAAAGVIVLRNEARQVGPLAIGGLDDFVTGHANRLRMLDAMRGLAGGRVVLSHSPDPFAKLPAGFGLMLAGHTHCGQIRLFGWAPVTNSRYGGRYACGMVRERGNTLIVTAGLGTSVVPVRLGALPDIWLVEVRGQ